MAEQRMPVIGDVIAEKYKIDKVLGEGGMGAVFAATHQITGKRVALKWMRQELANDEEAIQRFVREAQAAGRIDHPNVVDVYDVGKQGNTVFLVMEYLYGEPLTAVLERGPQDPTDIIQLLIPALRGVAAAHRQGVVHRDLKPDNIFLCRSPEGMPREAKVLDFGISKVTGQGNQTSPRLTRTGTMMGTPYYMSPEQVRGAKEIGPQVDIYAFGVILYEALAGKVPFHADTFSALVLEIATATPKPLQELRPDIPEKLSAIVMKAMARETKDRYTRIEDLGRNLEVFGGGVTFDVTSHNMRLVEFAKTNEATPTSGLNATSTPFASEAPISSIPGKRRSFPLVAVASLSAVVVVALAGAGYWTLVRKQNAHPASIVRPAAAAPAPVAPVAPAPLSTIAHLATPPSEPALIVAKEPPKEGIAAPDKSPDTTEKSAETKEDKTPVEPSKAVSSANADKNKHRDRAPKHPRTPSSRMVAQRNAQVAAPPVESKPAAAPERRAKSGRTGGLGLEEF